MLEVPIKLLCNNGRIPTYGSPDSAGADLYACLDSAVVCNPGATVFIPTGISMEIPAGYAGFIYARSGMACKRNVAPANKVGVIDSDYRGEIIVALYNHGEASQIIEPGERIAQIVIAPVFQARFTTVDSLGKTSRGAGGFGSTGK